MNAVEIKNINKSFKKFSLKDITFSVPKGCVVGLVGRNGSGKSTLIDIICSIAHADSGTVSVLGTDTKSSEFVKVKEHIGYVTLYYSFPFFFSAVDINNILKSIYETWDDNKFWNYLEKFNIDPYQKIAHYSQGMLVSLQIAAALSHDTNLLLFDEATNGLDVIIREDVLEILLDFVSNEKNSIIISSHMLDDLDKICDYIAYLDNGQLRFFEEKDSLGDKYSIVKCNSETFSRIDKNYIISEFHSLVGIEALVETCGIPENIYSQRATIKDIMIFTQKEE